MAQWCNPDYSYRRVMAMVWIIVIGKRSAVSLSAIYELYILPHPTPKPHHRGSKKLLDKKGIICR